MRRPSSTSPALLAALLLAAGCGRCGAPRTGPPAERFVPAGAAGALVIPRLEEASRQAGALQGTLAALPGAEELGSLRTVLGAQLSIDLFDPASLAAAGLDVSRSLAVAELPTAAGDDVGLPLLVLPVGDAAKLEALLARLARDRLGAVEKGLENANGKSLDVWRRAPGEPALLTTALAEGLLLVSAGPGGPDALRAALGLDPALSLAQSPAWRRARAALGEGPAVLLWLPPGSPALEGGLATDGLAAGLSATARSARLIGVALLGAQEARLRPLAGPGAGWSGPSPLGPGTVLAARLSASPAAALALLGDRPADPRLAALRTVAAGLEPPLDVGLSLSPRSELGALLASRGQIDPLRVARVDLVAHLRPGAAIAPALDALARSADGEGRDGRWRVRTGVDSEITWVLAGPILRLAAGPRAELEAQLASGGTGGFTAPSPASSEALAGGLGGAVLHVDNLAQAVKALPPEAFGSGPDGVMARSLAAKLAAPAGRHAAISLRADLPAGALRLSLDLELGEPPRAP